MCCRRVTPTANDSAATYVIKLGGVTDSDGVIDLAVGSNVITIAVTAEDDHQDIHRNGHAHYPTYTITVTRATSLLWFDHPSDYRTLRVSAV